MHLLCSQFSSYRDLPLTVGLEFIEPGRACVSFVLLYWFISHQYTRRNTNSVTHSTAYTIRSICQSIYFVVCSFLSESGILIKIKKMKYKKNEIHWCLKNGICLIYDRRLPMIEKMKRRICLAIWHIAVRYCFWWKIFAFFQCLQSAIVHCI